MIPAAPRGARFVQVGGRLMQPGCGLFGAVVEAVERHRGDLYVIGGTAGGARPETWRLPPELHLAFDPAGCRALTQDREAPLSVCPCSRLPEPAGP